MGFSVLDVTQRSPEWIAARLGRLTASRAADMLATIQKGEAAARRNLRVQLVLERLTGISVESAYQSQAMIDGINREAAALRTYEAITGRIVRRSGFLVHDSLMAGASLDGHLGKFEVVVEAKSPIQATHLNYLRTGKVPLEYAAQITHQMWITGAAEGHFLSYQPDFPEALRVVLMPIVRDTAAIDAYDKAARTFLAEVEIEFQALSTMANPFRVLAKAVA